MNPWLDPEFTLVERFWGGLLGVAIMVGSVVGFGLLVYWMI